MVAGTIHLVGDSTLDNLFWIMRGSNSLETARERSIEGLLSNRVNKEGFEVANHAYDGFTTHSVLGEDLIGSVLSFPIEYMNERAPDGTHKVSPLKKLQEKISESPDAPHYVVLSVGGNDFRVNLGNPWKLLKDIPKVQQRYLQIVEKLQGLEGRNIRLILMLQYRTDANNDPYLVYTVLKGIGFVAIAIHLLCLATFTASLWVVAGRVSTFAGGLGFAFSAIGLYHFNKVIPLSLTKEVLTGKDVSMVLIGNLLELFYRPILERAKLSNLPVLDLTNTFNPYHRLYDSGIEPNEEGGKLIAEGIYHIVKHHHFESKSMLYSKPNESATYTSQKNENPANWQITYPSSQ